MKPDFDSSDDTSEVIKANNIRFYGVLACMVHSLCTAGSTTVVKVMHSRIHPIVIMIFATIFQFLLSIIGMIFDGWEWPDSNQWFHLFVMSILYFGGQFFLMKALQNSDRGSSLVVSMNYLQLPLAYVFDIGVFGFSPSISSLFGTGFVIAGCVLIVKYR